MIPDYYIQVPNTWSYLHLPLKSRLLFQNVLTENMLGFFDRQRHIFRLEILHLNDLHNRFVVIPPGRNYHSVTRLN